MKNKFLKSIALSMSLLMSTTSIAGLINMGSGMVYDDVLDVTWLLDANYMGTRADLASASAWASSLVYEGYDDWRLPTTDPVNGATYNTSFTFNGTSDRGYNNDSTASELGYMFYNNLNNVSFYSNDGRGPQAGSDSINSSFVDAVSGIEYMFENIQLTYWSDSASPFANSGWAFNFGTNSGIATGEQQLFVNSASLSAWAVRDGMVTNTLNVNNPPTEPTEVPEPSTIAVFTLGLLGLVSRKFKK